MELYLNVTQLKLCFRKAAYSAPRYYLLGPQDNFNAVTGTYTDMLDDLS